MIRLAVAAAFVGGLGGCAGQTTTTRVGTAGAGQTGAGQNVIRGDSIPAGTQLVTQLETTVGKDSRPGELYSARIIQGLVDANGQPIIPAGSQVVGRVLDVRKASNGQPAAVNLSVDTLRIGRAEHPVSGSIVAADVEAPRRGVDKRFLGGGAAAGGVLGAILGGWEGAVIGGVVGAAAGTGISLGLQEKEARLPEGTALAIRLDRSISVASLRRPPAY